jgi:hypothetical protein
MQGQFKETFMNTQISSKLAALAIALVMNTVIIGAVAHLFTVELQPRATAMSQDGSSAPSTRVVA